MRAPEPKPAWDTAIREFIETTSFDEYPTRDEFLAYISQDGEEDE